MTEPCTTCAVRPGTDAAESHSTQLTFRLCVLSGEEFSCHERPGPCAGWEAAMRNAKAVPAWQRKLGAGLLEIHDDNCHGLVSSEAEGVERIMAMVEAIDEQEKRFEQAHGKE